jgi:O-antigen/teichoic acid export membrane protein
MASKVKFNFIYNLIYHIFTIIVPLITTPYVSRALGTAGVGDYAYAYSIAHYFSLFIKLGLNNYGNRTIAYSRGDKDKMSSDFWNIYCFQFITSIVVLSVYLIYCFFISSYIQISLLFIILMPEQVSNENRCSCS